MGARAGGLRPWSRSLLSPVLVIAALLAPTAGDYFFEVSRYQYGGSPVTGSYSLDLEDLGPDDHGNTAAAASSGRSAASVA